MNLQRYVLSYQQNRQAIHVRRNAHRSKEHVRDYVILHYIKGRKYVSMLQLQFIVYFRIDTHKRDMIIQIDFFAICLSFIFFFR